MNWKEKQDDEEETLEIMLSQMMEIFDVAKEKFGNRLRFMMHLNVLSESRCWIEKELHVHNMDLNTLDLQNFGKFIALKFQQLNDFQNQVVHSGKMLVVCINDKKQPKKLKEKLKKGNMYMVKKILVNKKGKAVYKLENVNDEIGIAALNASRFQSLINASLS